MFKTKNITCFPKAHSAKWLPFDWEEILKQRVAEVVLPTTEIEKDKGVLFLDNKNRVVSGSYAENAQWVGEQMVKFVKENKK